MSGIAARLVATQVVDVQARGYLAYKQRVCNAMCALRAVISARRVPPYGYLAVSVAIPARSPLPAARVEVGPHAA